MIQKTYLKEKIMVKILIFSLIALGTALSFMIKPKKNGKNCNCGK